MRWATMITLALAGLWGCPGTNPPTEARGAPPLCPLPARAPAPYVGQPARYAVVDDHDWAVIDTLGWQLLWGPATTVTDPSAPFSPPLAAQIVFPVGFVGGAAAATLSYDFAPSTGVYASMWWKISAPWQGHPSNSNKIAYLFTENSGSMSLMMYGTPGGPYELRVFPDWHGAWLVPNVSTPPVSLGAWHHLEWQVQYGPTADPPSGTVRWWMDGALVGNYCDVRLSGAPLMELKLAPVWGGAEPVQKTETDYVRYGPVHISALKQTVADSAH